MATATTTAKRTRAARHKRLEDIRHGIDRTAPGATATQTSHPRTTDHEDGANHRPQDHTDDADRRPHDGPQPPPPSEPTAESNHSAQAPSEGDETAGSPFTQPPPTPLPSEEEEIDLDNTSHNQSSPDEDYSSSRESTSPSDNEQHFQLQRSTKRKNRREQKAATRKSTQEPPQKTSFRILQTDDWTDEYSQVLAIERALPQLKTTFTTTRMGNIILTTTSPHDTDILKQLTTFEGKAIKIQEIRQEDRTRKIILTKVPTCITTDRITQHPDIISAKRCTHATYTNGQRITQPTRQVEITVKGRDRTNLDLGHCLGTYQTRDYRPEPTRCFNCQSFGHLARNCQATTRCALCAATHDTRQCPHPAQGKIPYKCHNCNGPHSAASLRCPRRRILLEKLNLSQPNQTKTAPAPRPQVQQTTRYWAQTPPPPPLDDNTEYPQATLPAYRPPTTPTQAPGHSYAAITKSPPPTTRSAPPPQPSTSTMTTLQPQRQQQPPPLRIKNATYPANPRKTQPPPPPSQPRTTTDTRTNHRTTTQTTNSYNDPQTTSPTLADTEHTQAPNKANWPDYQQHLRNLSRAIRPPHLNLDHLERAITTALLLAATTHIPRTKPPPPTTHLHPQVMVQDT